MIWIAERHGHDLAEVSVAPPTSETYQLLNTIINLLRVISFDFQLRNYIGTIAELMPKR